MDENRVMKEFKGVKKILGHQISRDSHQSAANRGGSTEDFSKNGLDNAKNIKTSKISKKN